MQPLPLSVLRKKQQIWLKELPKVEVITNQYETRFNTDLRFFRIFQIVVEPAVQKDSYLIYKEAIDCMPETIKKKLACLYFGRRGYSVWFIAKEQMTKEEQNFLKMKNPTYQLTISNFEYKISFKYVKQSSLHNAQNLSLITQFLNIKLKNVLIRQCKMKQLFPNVFFPQWASFFKDQKFSIEAQIGFKPALNYIQIQLLCDINNRVRQRNTKTFLETLLQKRQDPNFYIGKRVTKNYGNQGSFVIDAIDFNKNPLFRFRLKNDEEVTLKEYYERNYKIKVHDLRQPLIVTNSRYDYKIKRKGKQLEAFQETIYLIPELVSLNEIPDKSKQIFRKQLQMSPNKCISAADDFIKNVNKGQKQKQFQISHENRRGFAHLLPQPIIQINPYTQIQPREGAFKISTEIYEPIDLKDVLVVYSVGKDKNIDRKQIDQAIDTLNYAGKMYKIRIAQKFQLQIQDNSPPETWVNQIEDDIKKNSKPNFVIIALMNHETQIKDYLKKELTYRLGVESQMFLRAKLHKQQKGNVKIAANVMKQIASKKNTTLWKIQSMKKFSDKLVLIIGVSILRANKGFELVISRNIDKDVSKYKIQQFQIDSKQIPDHILEETFYKVIEEYIKFERKKYKPTTIIVYRLGLNNQKYAEEHLEKESRILKERVEYISKTKFQKEKYEPEIVYIKVVDRPSQKYWIQEEGNQPGSFLPRVINPQCGTVMRGSDDNEFYLMPYKARQGTAQPSLYRIFKNDSQVPIDFIAQYTYAMTYLYTNWEGAVRIPQVLQLCKKTHQFVKPVDDYKKFTFETPICL